MDISAEDARDSVTAMSNQIPPTMSATQAVLSLFATCNDLKGEDGKVSVDKLARMVVQAAATQLITVIELENRLERSEGRPGVSDQMIVAIFNEFATLGGS